MLVHLVLEADRFLADLDERAPDHDNELSSAFAADPLRGQNLRVTMLWRLMPLSGGFEPGCFTACLIRTHCAAAMIRCRQ
jgi:hypothetical protein